MQPDSASVLGSSCSRTAHILAGAALSLQAACWSAAGPVAAGDRVVVVGLNDAPSLIVVPQQQRMAGGFGPYIGLAGGSALSHDSALLLIAGETSRRDSMFVAAVHTRSGETAWRVHLWPNAGFPGFTVILPKLLALSKDARTLYLYPVTFEGTTGIATVDLARRVISGFLGIRINGRRIIMLHGGSSHPPGTLVITATRDTSRNSRPNAAFFLSPSLEVLDSVLLPTGAKGAYDLVASPDERKLYVMAPPHLLLVDVPTKGLVRDVSSTPAGLLAISTDGLRVFETDPGDGLTSLGSGLLREYSADLLTRREIELRADSTVGLPRAGRDVVVSTDGSLAYVLSGAAAPVGPFQAAALSVVDLQGGRTTAMFALSDRILNHRLYTLRSP